MSKKEVFYKVLHEDGRPRWGGSGIWSLPEGDKPGEWMPPIEGRLVPCVRGYHLCRPNDLINWIDECVFEVEWQGKDILEENDKVVVREARLLRKVANWDINTFRLFACDCVEHAATSVLSDGKDHKEIIAFVKAALKAARDCARNNTSETWFIMGDARRAILNIEHDYQDQGDIYDLLFATRKLVQNINSLRIAILYSIDSLPDELESKEKEWQSERLLEYITGKRV